jgi:hypothetical protein
MPRELQERRKIMEETASIQNKPSSVATAFLSFGLIVSARKEDEIGLRKAIEKAGGKIVFQTVTTAPLYVLRHYQVEQILQGEVSWLQAVHDRKSKERRVEK